MGFAAQLCKYPKILHRMDKTKVILTVEDLQTYTKCFEYENNDWNKEHYKSLEDYLKSFWDYNGVVPNEFDIHSMAQYLKEDEYGHKELYEELYYAGSAGGGKINECFSQDFKGDTGYVEITKENLPKYLKRLRQIVKDMDFKEFWIKDVYREYNDDELGECKKVFNVDGVNLISEDDEALDLWASEEAEGIITNKNYFDTWSWSALNDLFDALLDCLDNFDWDNYILVYYG